MDRHRRPALRLNAGIAAALGLLLAACSEGPQGQEERLGTSRQAFTLAFSAGTSTAVASSAMATVTASTGTAPYTCVVTSQTSGGTTCSVTGNVVSYTAGATAGYNIKANRTGADHFQIVGGAVQANAPLASAELFILASSGSGFTFRAKSTGSYVRSVTNSLIADATAATADVYPRTDCNTTTPTVTYNRFGFNSLTGTNKYWKVNTIPNIETVNSGNGAACSGASSGAWEAFYLIPGTDTLTVTDRFGNAGTIVVSVENPIAFIPASRSTSPSTAISSVQAWGGSAQFTGCSVLTNASAGPNTCSVTTGGVVTYTPGATAGVDVLQVADHHGHTGTFNVTVAAPFALSSTTSVAIASSPMTSVTASGGTGPYTCSILSNTSSGTSCSVNAAGVVSYTAGANAGYYIRSTRTTDYLQLVNEAGTPHVETGGALGTQLFVLSAVGSGFTFRAGTNYVRHGGAGGNYLVADTAVAASAIGYTPQDCNGTGNAGYYNRFGFKAPSGSNPHWKVNTIPFVSSLGGGNNGPCDGAGTGPWEGFELTSGSDTLKITDSAGNSGNVTVKVENPLAVWPSAVTVATSSPMPSTLHAWGGSGVYTGSGAGCAVLTNQTGSAGTCTVKGSGWISYTTGATAGTDTLRITDTEGHTVTVPITVVSNVTQVSLTPTQPPVSLAPKATTGLSVATGTGLTWTLVTNNSGGTLNSTTGVFTAGATGDVSDLVQITDGSGTTGYVTVYVGPGVSISPSQPGVPPSTSLNFAASGGTGSGYTWSLSTNVSGGSVNASGVYTAGATSGTDVIRVVDSVGNEKTVPITVSCGADKAQQILYPYDGTVFPLGMLPPLVQWKNSAGATHAKITLQYPTTGTPTFSWSKIVYLNGPLSAPYNNLPTALPVTGGGRAEIPELVWRTLATAAKGSEALIKLQLLESSKGTIASSIKVRFATEQLKGKIYYQSYDSTIASSGNTTGGTLAITVGNATPTAITTATNGSGCRDCHAVSADGRRLVTQHGGVTMPQLYATSQTIDLSSGVTQTAITNNNDGRFAWPAISPDGSLMFTNSGVSPSWMSAQWASAVANATSGLYTLPGGDPVPTVGIASGMHAMFPTFATDGSAVAFNYNSDDGRTLATMSVTKDAPMAGSYTFGAPVKLFQPSIDAAATYVTGAGVAAWPSYMPAGQNGIVVQRVPHHNCAESGSDGSTSVNSDKLSEHNIGALGELWWVNTTGTPLPARLNKANGMGYLPSGPNGHGVAGTTVPTVSVDPTDTAGGTPSLAQFTSEGNGTNACRLSLRTVIGSGDDTRLNFKPTVNPTTTGGYQWVVFMSRRMYGNVATINPYASDPRHTDEIDPTKAAAKGYALQPSPKKLWVAAMKANATPGSDPSYPAFYLDGQELYSGNSRGYWVLPQCVAPSATRSAATLCTTTDDCCQSPASKCVLDIPVSTNPPTSHCVPNSAITCAADNAACNVDADCCNALSSGARCSANKCTVPMGTATSTGYPNSESVTYDFYGECTERGTRPIWRFLQSQQVINGDSSIEFLVQSAATMAALPTAPAGSTHTATATAQAPQFTTGPKTIDEVLASLMTPQGSRAYLRVTATLNPSSDHTQTPVLTSMTPTYDCLFDE
jgi:hypothetical protein